MQRTRIEGAFFSAFFQIKICETKWILHESVCFAASTCAQMNDETHNNEELLQKAAEYGSGKSDASTRRGSDFQTHFLFLFQFFFFLFKKK